MNLLPENIMVQMARLTSDWTIKLTDFSMARSSEACEELREPANNSFVFYILHPIRLCVLCLKYVSYIFFIVRYVAPEVLKSGYQHPKAADVWNIGILLFYMVFGFLPFDIRSNETNDRSRGGAGGNSPGTSNSSSASGSATNLLTPDAERAIAKQIKHKGFKNKVKAGFGPWFPESMPISQGLRVLISSMLNYDYDLGRWSALQCLFYLGNIADGDVNGNKLCWLCEYEHLASNWSIESGMCHSCQMDTKDVSNVLNKLNRSMMSSKYQFFGWEKICKITNLLINDWHHDQSGHTLLTLAILRHNKFPDMAEELLIRHVRFFVLCL